MALYIFYRNREEDRRASGQHSALVSAVDEATARTVGGIPTSWVAHELAASGETMPFLPKSDGSNDRLQVLLFEGDCASLRQIGRGGSPILRDRKVT
jgi:hypothetical protein